MQHVNVGARGLYVFAPTSASHLRKQFREFVRATVQPQNISHTEILCANYCSDSSTQCWKFLPRVCSVHNSIFLARDSPRGTTELEDLCGRGVYRLSITESTCIMEFSGFSPYTHSSDYCGLATLDICTEDPENNHESSMEAGRVSYRIPKPKREYKSLTLKKRKEWQKQRRKQKHRELLVVTRITNTSKSTLSTVTPGKSSESVNEQRLGFGELWRGQTSKAFIFSISVVSKTVNKENMESACQFGRMFEMMQRKFSRSGESKAALQTTSMDGEAFTKSIQNRPLCPIGNVMAVLPERSAVSGSSHKDAAGAWASLIVFIWEGQRYVAGCVVMISVLASRKQLTCQDYLAKSLITIANIFSNESYCVVSWEQFAFECIRQYNKDQIDTRMYRIFCGSGSATVTSFRRTVSDRS